jgi:hypothetical protein
MYCFISPSLRISIHVSSMSEISDSRSRTPNFGTRKSPKFVFVTINNPKDIRDRTKQTRIRSHARKDAGRRVRKQKGFHFIYESGSTVLTNDTPNPNPADPAGTVIQAPKFLECNEGGKRSSNDQPNLTLLSSIASIRPLGAGRGYNPFASFPIKSTPRVVQLIDSC